jgi:hypothetical protein
MKNLAILATIVLGLMVGSSFAQPVDTDTVIIADIPFSFTVENAMLPAGKYEISRIGARDDSEAFLEFSFTIASAKGDVKTVFSTEPSPSTMAAQSYDLEFDDINGVHFLSKIFFEGDTQGYYLPKPRSELRMLKNAKIKVVKVTGKKK